MFECLDDRHHQFTQQAQWTKSIRAYLIERSQLMPDDKCLEVGCGTGALLTEWEHFTTPAVGIDIDFSSLQYAGEKIRSLLCASDAQSLPFTNQSFDCIFSHYFFLWVKQPKTILLEIKRCLRPGGTVLIFAEPDYGGRIDFPLELAGIRDYQIRALTKHGADPLIGRKLKEMLRVTGFIDITGGIIGSEWPDEVASSPSIDMENILFDMANSDAAKETQTILEIDKNARANGTRVSFVPTFFYTAVKS